VTGVGGYRIAKSTRRKSFDRFVQLKLQHLFDVSDSTPQHVAVLLISLHPRAVPNAAFFFAV